MHSILITDSTFVSASLTLRHCSSSCLLRFPLSPLLSFFFFLILLLLRYFLLGLLLSSCLTSPDVILVYDGIDSTAPIIGQYCNTKAFVELVSTRKNLFVEFHSRSHFPGQVSTIISWLVSCIMCFVFVSFASFFSSHPIFLLVLSPIAFYLLYRLTHMQMLCTRGTSVILNMTSYSNSDSSHVDSPANFRSFIGQSDLLSYGLRALSERVTRVNTKVRVNEKGNERINVNEMYRCAYGIFALLRPFLLPCLCISVTRFFLLSLSHVLTLGKQMPSPSPPLCFFFLSCNWFMIQACNFVCHVPHSLLFFLFANALPSLLRILLAVRSVFFVTPAAVYSHVSLHPFLFLLFFFFSFFLPLSLYLTPPFPYVDWLAKKDTRRVRECEEKKKMSQVYQLAEREEEKLTVRLHLCSMKIV